MHTGTGKLPWRLTKDAVACVDARIRRIIYPHGIDGCSNDEGSFINGHRSWRAADRILALLVILPTVLRDFVPELRAGLRKFVWGMRILKGRCFNSSQAMQAGTAPGETPLFHDDIDKAETLIVEGLSMSEGKSVRSSVCICFISPPPLSSRSLISYIITQVYLPLTTFRLWYIALSITEVLHAFLASCLTSG